MPCVGSNQDVLHRFADRNPLGRPAQDAVFVNGVNLPVDGGVTASNGQPRLM